MPRLPDIRRLSRWIPRFAASERGNVVILFALFLIPVITFIGMAIDYGRAARARSAMQNALDTAALMLSRDVSQGTITEAELPAKALAYFNALYTNTEALGVTVTATYSPQTISSQALVKLTASGHIKSDFMQIAGFPTLGFGTSTSTAWGHTKLRVALVLDNTGSMFDNGKLDALKGASKTLIDQLTTDVTPGTDDVLISLVPFTTSVNVGPQYYNESWLSAWTTPRAGGYAIDWNSPRVVTSNGFPAWEAEPLKLQTQKPQVPYNWTQVPWPMSPNCPFGWYDVNGNDGNLNFALNNQFVDMTAAYYLYTLTGATVYSFVCQAGPTDPANPNNLQIVKSVPSSGLICPSADLPNVIYYNGCYNSKANRVWTPNPHSTWNGCVSDRDQPYDTQNDPPTGDATSFPVYQALGCPTPLKPLGSDWTSMKAQIDAMVAGGNTNQAIGLHWGWMTLTTTSPFGPGSPLNAPADTDASANYNRAVILLSDGLNTQSRWSTSANAAADIDTRQQILCTNMKSAGITIYTIQVNTTNDPKSAILASCASSQDDFFYVTSSNQILDAFNAIGARLKSLRITQ